MIMQDYVTDLILKFDLFMSKNGTNLDVTREVMKDINAITGEDSLDTIYVNTTDNFLIPDVVVAPLYNDKFSEYLMNPDLTNTCPFGYTIEIHHRCFTKYTAEELTAVVLHDILQNVTSDTAKMRFLKAYTAVISKYRSDAVLNLFDGMSHSEVVFMIFMDICTRPFKVPVNDYDYTGTDDTLKAMGLGKAYDAYLIKCMPVSNDTPEERINMDILDDHRCTKTVIDACLDKDIRHYYSMIKDSAPLVTLDHILGSKQTVVSLGFISRQRTFKRRNDTSNTSNVKEALSESFSKTNLTSPKTPIEIRFQIDKIISEMRYAESEGEREVILFKIKQLSLQLVKMEQNLNKELEKNPANKAYQDRFAAIKNFQDELDMLRDKTLKMDIKKTYLGIWCKSAVPGYDY